MQKETPQFEQAVNQGKVSLRAYEQLFSQFLIKEKRKRSWKTWIQFLSQPDLKDKLMNFT